MPTRPSWGNATTTRWSSPMSLQGRSQASSDLYWAVQWSWFFAWVNALRDLSHKKSQKVTAATCIGQFSEAVLHEWMPCIIFCARSHERSQLPLLGQFRSRSWFTLCITMEAKPRTAKQNKCHNCLICRNYRGKVMEDEKKGVFALFFGWQEDHKCVREKNEFFGIL